MNVTEVVDEIQSIGSASLPVLIAIEGFGGAGKTTIAEQLRVGLGDAYVITIDDFIVKEKLMEPSWDKGAFDRHRLEQQVLIPATTDHRVAYQKLDWIPNTLSAPINVPKVRYLIIEGISSYHPDIAHYYGYKIWIDTPIELAKQRGKVRDENNENAQHWYLWSANDLRYQQKFHPELRADFVVSNSV